MFVLFNRNQGFVITIIIILQVKPEEVILNPQQQQIQYVL